MVISQNQNAGGSHSIQIYNSSFESVPRNPEQAAPFTIVGAQLGLLNKY
jgi:hypothetical protein